MVVSHLKDDTLVSVAHVCHLRSATLLSSSCLWSNLSLLHQSTPVLELLDLIEIEGLVWRMSTSPLPPLRTMTISGPMSKTSINRGIPDWGMTLAQTNLI